jgi:hypothetical protein
MKKHMIFALGMLFGKEAFAFEPVKFNCAGDTWSVDYDLANGGTMTWAKGRPPQTVVTSAIKIEDTPLGHILSVQYDPETRVALLLDYPYQVGSSSFQMTTPALISTTEKTTDIVPRTREVVSTDLQSCVVWTDAPPGTP